MGIGTPSPKMIFWGLAIAAAVVLFANRTESGKKYLGPKAS